MSGSDLRIGLVVNESIDVSRDMVAAFYDLPDIGRVSKHFYVSKDLYDGEHHMRRQSYHDVGSLVGLAQVVFFFA